MKKLVLACVVGVLAVTAIGYLTAAKSGIASRPITVSAQFDEASGLYPGNAVEVLGMQVGTVQSVTAKGSYVEVVLSIDEDIQVPADVMAATISSSILTDRRVALSPAYTGGPVLEDHDVIPLDRTRTPVGFDRVLATIDRLMAAMNGDGHGGGPLADLVNVGAETVAGKGNDIKGALDQLSKALRMTSDGAQTKDDLTTIVTSLSALVKAASDNDATIREFGSLVRATSAVLAAENFGSGTTGRRTNEVLEAAADLLEENRDTINQAVTNGDVLLTATNDHNRELAETFDLLPLLLENVYNAIDVNNGSLRAHALVDKMMFDSQMTKEVCNLMGLRQLGCSTGTLQDYGPDFGLTYMLDSMARIGQR
ncbi:MCE family protein [Mycolicibacterium holsaticum]|uniref:Mammalian cell entry protein n=1 Tax=Mycolicibacterium holsaticum TaxID=152142 RepID=A0A1E3S312_9MYCO|nr:MCE family protein [Mycolicibacterium holsaticum]ODQ96556.1 mammalian cell entry protein [Mycolicibacterium holsaticum]